MRAKRRGAHSAAGHLPTRPYGQPPGPGTNRNHTLRRDAPAPPPDDALMLSNFLGRALMGLLAWLPPAPPLLERRPVPSLLPPGAWLSSRATLTPLCSSAFLSSLRALVSSNDELVRLAACVFVCVGGRQRQRACGSLSTRCWCGCGAGEGKGGAGPCQARRCWCGRMCVGEAEAKSGCVGLDHTMRCWCGWLRGCGRGTQAQRPMRRPTKRAARARAHSLACWRPAARRTWCWRCR